MVNFDDGMKLVGEFYQEIADETRLASNIARTFLQMRGLKVGRILQSRTAGDGRLYAFSVRKHVLVLILFVGNDALYGGFAHGMDGQWQRVFFGLKELLDNGESIFPLKEEAAKVDAEYGREIVCPELNSIGYRCFARKKGNNTTEFSLYWWPSTDSDPSFVPLELYKADLAGTDDHAWFVYFLGQISVDIAHDPTELQLLDAIWKVVQRMEAERRLLEEEYGRQIPCPEFEALGFRILVKGGLTWQEWKMVLWPSGDEKPYPYPPYFQREFSHMSDDQGLVTFIQELHSVLSRTPGEQGLKLAAEAIIKRLTGKEVSDAS